MPQMVCQRDYTLRTTTGHIIHFEAGKPRDVPFEVVDAAMAVNIIMAHGGHAEHAPEKINGPTRIASMSQEMRDALILLTIDELMRDAETANFDGGGKPKTQAIKERCGLDVNATERTRLFDRYRDLVGTNTPLPRPKNVEWVLAVQGCNSPAQLTEYLELFGVSKDSVRGYTLKEIKSVAVLAAMKYDDPASAPVVVTEGRDAGTLDEDD